MKKRKILLLTVILLPMIVAMFCHITYSPYGISFESPAWRVGEAEFVSDITYPQDGEVLYEHNIFDRAIGIIDGANEFIVLDLFLYNDDYARESAPVFKDSARLLTEALLAKKTTNPDISITVITDEINNFYGAYENEWFRQLKDSGISVIITKPGIIGNSNPIYSGIWCTYLQWFGTSGKGWLPNAFSSDSPRVTARSYLRLLNFKANHRKTLITENEAMITSSNIGHDASSLHSNIAFVVSGEILEDIYGSEQTVAALSGVCLPNREFAPQENARQEGGVKTKLITEKAIRDNIVAAVNVANEGDEIDMGVFYLSDRQVITVLKRASARGAAVRVILDANKDAFGREKNGIPNRQVAHELTKGAAAQIRWANTSGEQFHTKFIKVTGAEQTIIIGGSANFTKRNIGGYNLEADLMFVVPNDAPLAQELEAYFERLWSNDGAEYTLDGATFEETSWAKTLVYRFQEFTGLCTF